MTADVSADKLPAVGEVRRSLPDREALLTRLECERFLYDEAALLDAWALDDWFDLFAEDGRYVVPSTDAIYGDPDWDLALINEDKEHLAGRVQRLKSTWAHIENPHSRTSRLISNVRVLADDGREVSLAAAFVTYRSRPYQTTTYSGTLSYRLRRTPDGFLIVDKTVRLVHETLRDSGGVLSILLLFRERKPMKLRIDEEKCCGYAACLSAAPKLFDLGDDNIAVVLVPEPGPDQHAAAREAVAACPTDAIVIEE